MSKLTKKQKQEKYNCDGNCHPDFGLICPNANKCEETRVRELFSLIFAYSLFILNFIIIILVFIFKILKGE